MFQRRGVADNANDVVVDLDPVDDRAQIGLPERNLTIGDILAHFLPEPLDHFRRNFGCRRGLGLDAIERGLGPFTVKFEAADAIPQDIVQFGDAILHHAIEPLQLVGGIDDVALQGGDAPIDFHGLLGATGKGGGKNLGEALGGKQLP
ncbi:hypothetical protein [Afipia birgiae]|uniref:hypothetical protein n=1 Tax=Afipia birgiae TaxID=151414 RepID=UPI00058D54F8|nr:hypothetical protein [Afipia birgiae]